MGRGCIQSSNQVYDMVLDPGQPPTWEDCFITRDGPRARVYFDGKGLAGVHNMLAFCYGLRRHGKSYDIAPTRLLDPWVGITVIDRTFNLIELVTGRLVKNKSMHGIICYVNRSWRKLGTVELAGGRRDGLEMTLFYVAFTCVMTHGIKLSSGKKAT